MRTLGEWIYVFSQSAKKKCMARISERTCKADQTDYSGLARRKKTQLCL